MLDHVGCAVSDYARSKDFYEQALAPLGISLLFEPAAQAAGRDRPAPRRQPRTAGQAIRRRRRRLN